jgi:hypothetical protein
MSSHAPVGPLVLAPKAQKVAESAAQAASAPSASSQWTHVVRQQQAGDAQKASGVTSASWLQSLSVVTGSATLLWLAGWLAVDSSSDRCCLAGCLAVGSSTWQLLTGWLYVGSSPGLLR